LLGRLLEHHARTRTSDAIRSLMDLQPETARLVTDDGIEERPVDQVKVGQRIQVRPGDRIPVDGSVTKGVSSVDESLISGESMPVDKAVGDRVTAGSINKTGSFVFEATGVGSETALAHLIDLVKQAQSSRPPIQRLADRIAAVFVPVVFGIAAVTFGIWVAGMGSLTDAMVNAVAVLIISCPCALGLATPTAILVGTGKGAEHGLLIKAGDVIETAHQIQTVVLDKTGTLTLGRPAVTDILSLGERSEDDLLHLSASLEANSEHPIGIAIVEEAARRHLVVSAPDRFEAIAGGGVEGQVNGISVALGTERYLSASGVDTNREEMERLRQEGKTVVGVSVSGQIEGIIAVSDEVKPGAVEAVERLKEESIEVAMLTGDNIHAAEAVARSTGLDLVVADVLPEDKANRIKALQQDRGTVAMVGDGINDAPALAQADVGIAIGTGTDVAIESADVALMSGDLSGIPAIIRLSRRTMRIIRQNLFWAFAYNVILIPVAALGWLTPWGGPTLAAAAMAFSSVTVVGNALRLKRFTP
ncbi:TPA: heavy metal translocating P-type ATPase, partial [Candidatus Latescibacteria bacterium]|nr:heavy metal translocating P-type ATPase [Candidatus Latescibacterota bacterium]